jgi:hypothetical protein
MDVLLQERQNDKDKEQIENTQQATSEKASNKNLCPQV